MTQRFDKYVLVTGGAGFMGSHFLDYFVNKYPKYHFTCIDKLNYVSSYSTKYLSSNLEKPNFKFVQKDLSTDYDYLFNLLVTNFQKNKITDIINFAAESCVDRSFDSPLFFTKNNILGTQNLLECVRLLACQVPNLSIRFIHISTDEVYGEQDKDESTNELGNLNPTNPYAATKASIDLIIKSYQYSFKLPITIIRSNNVYGPRQYPEKIIPLALKCLINNEKIPLHGNGLNLRKYLHVCDFVTGIETIWNSPQTSGEIYNIGSNEEIDNLSLIKLICQIYFNNRDINYKDYIKFVKDRNYNDLRYSLDLSKIEKLGWRPETDLHKGITDLIDYCKDYLI